MRRVNAVLSELRAHAPFTLFGAVTGIIAMLLFARAPEQVSHRLFQVFHPLHVVLSAIVTASLFKIHESRRGFLVVLLIGYFGAIGVATLSDSVLPFFGESVLGAVLPTHADVHTHVDGHAHDADLDHEAAAGHEADHDHAGERDVLSRLYLGFIEDWYIVNPAAILGILIAWFWPHTRFPHAGHILISTWASSFHVLMNMQGQVSAVMLLGMLIVLFIAVWLPCCLSDIVFPMLFIRSPHVHPGCHHCAEEIPA
jgi:hypothetical protein